LSDVNRYASKCSCGKKFTSSHDGLKHIAGALDYAIRTGTENDHHIIPEDARELEELEQGRFFANVFECVWCGLRFDSKAEARNHTEMHPKHKLFRMQTQVIR
jgi:hypothetical protein